MIPFRIGAFPGFADCPVNCQQIYKGSRPKEMTFDPVEADMVWDFDPRLVQHTEFHWVNNDMGKEYGILRPPEFLKSPRARQTACFCFY